MGKVGGGGHIQKSLPNVKTPTLQGQTNCNWPAPWPDHPQPSP